MSKVVEVTKSGLESDIQSGMSRKDMAAKYGVSTIALSKVLKQIGLGNKRAPSVIIKVVEEPTDQPNINMYQFFGQDIKTKMSEDNVEILKVESIDMGVDDMLEEEL